MLLYLLMRIPWCILLYMFYQIYNPYTDFRNNNIRSIRLNTSFILIHSILDYLIYIFAHSNDIFDLIQNHTYVYNILKK